MEKENTEGFGSLFLLFLAILALTFCLELGGAENKKATKPGEQEELVDAPTLPATATPISAKATAKQRLII
ncbi:hypothetical protein ACFS7Z_15610 [Pontibacter toksunensis]|uniref:Uncharacterized protein n=1 Tax=Pontibacter toksunensis TaxID=1332631 RepID=A0ABW6BVE0_9BACT